MMYGLLIDSAVSEELQHTAWQAQQSHADEESWSLGMEAWVCCESPESD